MRPLASSVSSWTSAITPPRRSLDALGEHALEDADRELPADHRSDAKAPLGALGELLDPREQQPVQGLRDLDRPDLPGRNPAVPVGHDRTAIDQHPDDFLDEEGIALGTFHDQVPDMVRERLDLEQVRDEP